MKKAITILREALAQKKELEYNPSREASDRNDFLKPSGIVRTLDICSSMYDCDRCKDSSECAELFDKLVNNKSIS